MEKKTITAVLGPTNTGKTFLAIETMLSFDSGMIGFPLRLLAREVYDKVIKKCHPSKVALITGSSRGIGKAIAFRLAQEKCNIIVAAKSEEENPNLPGTIYSTSEQIRSKYDVSVLPHVLDVQVSFLPVHNFVPQRSIKESPFIFNFCLFHAFFETIVAYCKYSIFIVKKGFVIIYNFFSSSNNNIFDFNFFVFIDIKN